MNPAQQTATANNGDLSVFPPEVLGLICECLLPENDHAFSDKPDVVTFGQLNRSCNAAATKFLFRDITITFTVKNELPHQYEQWISPAWKMPELVQALQGSSGLRACVKNMRLRLCPVPVQDWTDESFNDIRARLQIHTGYWGSPAFDPRRQFPKIRDFNKDVPPKVPKRQEFVFDAYCAAYIWRCSWPEVYPWTETLEPLLRSLMSTLPALHHMETADAANDMLLSRSDAMMQWSLSYSDTLILRTFPPSVRSVGLRSWPPPAAIANDTQGGYLLGNQASNPQRPQDFMRSGAQLTELTIDCSSHYFWSASPSPVLDGWRDGLRQLRHLTTLTLSREPSRQVETTPRSLALKERIDIRLEYLFNEALVLQHVKTLTLIHWQCPAALFAERILASFPELSRLYLRSAVIFFCDNQRDGEYQWIEFAYAMKTGQINLSNIDDEDEEGEGEGGEGRDDDRSKVFQGPKVSLVIQDPRVAIEWSENTHQVVMLQKQARARLQEYLGQQIMGDALAKDLVYEMPRRP